MSSTNQKASEILEVLEPVKGSLVGFAAAFAVGTVLSSASAPNKIGNNRKYRVPLREIETQKIRYNITTHGRDAAAKLREKVQQQIETMTLEEFCAVYKLHDWREAAETDGSVGTDDPAAGSEPGGQEAGERADVPAGGSEANPSGESAGTP